MDGSTLATEKPIQYMQQRMKIIGKIFLQFTMNMKKKIKKNKSHKYKKKLMITIK